MHDPRPRQRRQILEHGYGLVLEDDLQRTREARDRLVRSRRGRHHQIANVQEVQEGRIQPAVQDVGVVVVLLVAIHRRHEAIVPSDVDRVVPLHIVEAREERAVVHFEQAGTGIGPPQCVGKGTAEDVARVPDVPEIVSCLHRLQEASGASGLVVVGQIHFMEFVRSRARLRIGELNRGCASQIGIHDQHQRGREQRVAPGQHRVHGQQAGGGNEPAYAFHQWALSSEELRESTGHEHGRQESSPSRCPPYCGKRAACQECRPQIQDE